MYKHHIEASSAYTYSNDNAYETLWNSTCFFVGPLTYMSHDKKLMLLWFPCMHITTWNLHLRLFFFCTLSEATPQRAPMALEETQPASESQVAVSLGGTPPSGPSPGDGTALKTTVSPFSPTSTVPSSAGNSTDPVI